jgi:hypothetical protein
MKINIQGFLLAAMALTPATQGSFLRNTGPQESAMSRQDILAVLTLTPEESAIGQHHSTAAPGIEVPIDQNTDSGIFAEIGNMTLSEGRDELSEAVVIQDALRDAYNRIHESTGAYITEVRAVREMVIPDPAFLDGKLSVNNGIQGTTLINNIYGWGCRLCTRGRSSGAPPVAEILTATTVLHRSSPAQHASFQDLFCQMLRDQSAAYPQFTGANECVVRFTYEASTFTSAASSTE